MKVTALITALRVWIRCSLRHVSSKADALARDRRAFERFTTTDAMAFPISRTAVQPPRNEASTRARPRSECAPQGRPEELRFDAP
jgi:hypothetical protein